MIKSQLIYQLTGLNYQTKKMKDPKMEKIKKL